MRKVKIYFLVLLIIITAGSAVSAENYGGNLKFKIQKRPLNLNPIYAFNDTEKIINKQIFDNLLVYNNKGEIVNNLSESWEINDDSTLFKFKLKKDIYFQPYKINGKNISLEQRKVTAADWKWSFEYLVDPKNKSPYAEIFEKVLGYDDYRQGKTNEISGIKVVDDYHLEIELENSYSPFIYNLLKEAAVVMPKAAVLNKEFNFSLNPIGTGSFKLKDFDKDKIVLIKNKNYWKNRYQKKKLPYLDQIELSFSTNNNLNNNYQEFDIYQLNRKELIYYYHNKLDDNYSLKEIINNNFYFAAFNYKMDKKIKNKIQSKLNYGEFNKTLKLNNLNYKNNKADGFELLNSIYCQNQIIKDNKGETFNKISLKMIVNNSDFNLKIAELLKAKFKTLNINLEVKTYNWTKYLRNLQNNLDSDLFMMSYTYDNKFDFISDNFYSKSKKNFFDYQNSRVDNLIDYIKLTKDKELQNKAYSIIKEILAADNPYLLIFKSQDNYLISDKLLNQDIFSNIYTRNNLESLYFK